MNVQPRLVMDTETNRLCVQICIGSHSATLPLPAGLKAADKLGLEAFFDLVVPQMIKGINMRRRAEQKQLMKDAKKHECSAQADGKDQRKELIHDSACGNIPADARTPPPPHGSQGVP